MDYAERRKQYLRVYRQQLIRETDAMGYGKANGHEPNLRAPEAHKLGIFQAVHPSRFDDPGTGYQPELAFILIE